jgi:hypothetical protein
MQELKSKKKPVVVARLTAIRSVGVRTIIEVCADASFHNFYRYYTQHGTRRSTKTQVRTASRNEGLHPWHRAYRLTPGLEVLASRMLDQKQFSSVKVRILKKRVYGQLLEAVPDTLGLTKVTPMTAPWILPTPRIPVNIPAGWLTIEKRMNIILGRS